LQNEISTQELESLDHSFDRVCPLEDVGFGLANNAMVAQTQEHPEEPVWSFEPRLRASLHHHRPRLRGRHKVPQLAHALAQVCQRILKLAKLLF
jgi:hypothetical protein